MTNKACLTAFLAMLAASTVHAQKIVPAYEAEVLPGPEEESALWERASSHENRLRNAGTLFRNRHIEAYIESVAERMLGDTLDHLGIEVDFVLVSEPVLSAWAYPYGTIGLHTGLLVRMDNEAQFGAILAHELSHFMQRHTYREILDGDRQSKVGKGLGFLASLALAKETGTFDSGVMDLTGNIWENLATSGYSKKNEYIADEEGLVLMHRANLPIEESIPAFEALGENSVYGAADPRKMWSSHPRLEDRIKNLRREIRKMTRSRDFEAAPQPDPLVYFRGIAPALLINARLDIRERQFARAREALEKYLLVHPDDPEDHYLIGETHRRTSPMGPNFTESQTAYRAALLHDSAYAPALKELGMTYRIQRQNVEARTAFEEYLRYAEDAPDAGIVRAYMEAL